MIEVLISGTRTLFFGTSTKLYKFEEGGTVTDVTRLSGDYTGNANQSATVNESKWSFVEWNGTIYASNGKDAPQRYRSGTDTEFDDWTPTDAPTTVEVYRQFKDFLIAFNTSTDARGLEWSDEDDPTEWSDDVDNAAGFLPIRDLESPIIAVEPLGEGLGAYGYDQLFLVQFVGAPLYFGAVHLLTGIGAVSKQAVTTVGRLHYGMGPRGIWETDGSQFRYIDTPDIREYIYEENLLRGQISKTVAIHDPSRTTVDFYWPGDTTGQSAKVTKGAGFNYRLRNWTIYGAVRTAGTEGAIFDFPLFADNDGNVWKSSIESAEPSADLPLTLEATYSVASGYGNLGYGESGYGGLQQGEG